MANDAGRIFEQILELGLSLGQREALQVVAVQLQDIKGVKEDGRALLADVIGLKELEGGAAFLVQGDNLSVKDLHPGRPKPRQTP